MLTPARPAVADPYRALFDAAADALVLVDTATGRILEANVAATTLYGYSRDALLQLKHTDLSTEPDQTRQATAEAQPRVPLRYHRTQDGTVFPVEITARHLLWAGRSVHLAAIRDITARVQTEAALRHSAEQHRILLQTAMDGFWLADTQGRLLEVNATYCRMSGYSETELLALHISDLEATESPAATAAHIQTILAQGEDRFESRHRRKDGTLFDVEVSVQYRPTDGGRFVVFVRDITARKSAEAVQGFLARTSSGGADEPFFHALARYLAQSLGMDFVRIDRLEGDGLTARTVAVWCDGQFEDNVTYALKDTPCGDVAGKTVCCFPASVCQFFPRDQVLQDLRAESYVGVTLWSHAGQPIGLIAVIGRRPLENRQTVEATLQLVGVRAAGELERLEAEVALRTRTAHLDAVRETTIDILREIEPSRLMDLILTRAIALTRTTSGTLYLWDEAAQLLTPEVNHGLGEWYRAVRLSPGEGVAGTVAQRREGVLVNDYPHSPYVLPRIQVLHPEATQGRTSLGEPLLYQGHLLGVLLVRDKVTGAPFDEKDAQLLRLFANQAAIAIENARLFEEVRAGRERLQTLSRRQLELQESERRTLARELHDEIGQLLTGLKLTLDMVAGEASDTGQSLLRESQDLVGELIGHVRELSLNLRPALLDDLGLLPALLWQFGRYTTRTQIQVDFQHVGLDRRPCSPDVETAAYRIVQEALTNVARHAEVRKVQVRLRVEGKTLHLRIEDQGCGFEPTITLGTEESSGLAGMHERALLLGGRLRIESSPGAGTCILAELPLAPGVRP